MTNVADVFGPGSNFKKRFVKDYKKLGEIVESLKKLNLPVVLVLGTYDLPHIGHARYLEKAKQQGAIVVVGVDPDEAVKLRKGPRRPIVPHDERLEMLTHLRHVDLVTLTSDFDEKGISGYELIRTIKPDIFIMTKMNEYSDAQIAEMKKYAGKIVLFPAQAATTTSAKIRLLTLDFVEKAKKTLEALVDLQ